ncbi:hypothetical protein LTS08_008072 [Lithohypha guttulata]|uniref:CoA-transferase family III n=1 Tax=Lithohypha guttulata TaxID=1690604 RepID=A0AAN7YHP6_9EURO|nr:hypothetical protein LTR51_005078 [Lithohypha guttulata]KAK5087826.1 hypothetical protein LTR05_002041 [Lithohypha guttulata]KAK5095430.1 hypothetical protein LTS08_008072 [Lithohypha guttulata]
MLHTDDFTRNQVSNGQESPSTVKMIPGTSNGSTPPNPDRSSFEAKDSIVHLLEGMSLPSHLVESVDLSGEGLGLPSSFKIAHLAQSSIALTALLASTYHSLRPNGKVSRVTVPLQHAVVEFKSERLYSLDGKPAPNPRGPIGGLHKSSDGHVRLHDSFPNHREGTKHLLGCSDNADRAAVGQKIADWTSIDLESAAFESKLVISALRSYKQWDVLPQAKAIADFPISITKIVDGPAFSPTGNAGDIDKCLRGIKVLEMSRVIAAPLAGKTLAVHGADVLWITSPELPDLPALDRDFARGKRTAQLNIDKPEDKARLQSLVANADVFIQGFRPGSLAARGLSPDALAAQNPQGIICANMSAYGPDGPWSDKRGFDSLVQTCSGMNVSEAEHYGAGEAARPTPCQALDHTGGYFLAAGIIAALYKRATEGGSYKVDVSLAGVMKYLRSLGQFPGKSGFECKDINSSTEVADEYMETRKSGFGVMRSVKHSATIDGMQVGWDHMPKPLGSDEPRWL